MRRQQLPREAVHDADAQGSDRSGVGKAEMSAQRHNLSFDAASAAGDRETKVHVIQGQFYVTDEPQVVLSTLLGSCVAACIRDPFACVGGMNHFLLPGFEENARSREAERYGVHL